jgi:DNA-binding transcriptional LysR family regulator
MEPNWDDFKVLLALVRAGSIAGAARALAIDHSTVSRRLLAIEEALGARLLMRGGREFSWTEEGRAALAAAEAVEGSVSVAARTIRAAKLEVAGSVTVSCPSGLVHALTRMLPAARDKFPLLAIQFAGENRTIDFGKGEADIALRMFRPSESGLVARRAFELGWGAYASKDYVAKHGVPASVGDLPNHQLVLYVEAMHQVPGPRWIEDHRGTATKVTLVDNTEVASHVIGSGGGIGVIPCIVADGRPELVQVFPEPVAFNTGWIVYHEAMRDTARVRAAIDVLIDFFEAHVPLFTGRRSENG